MGGDGGEGKGEALMAGWVGVVMVVITSTGQKGGKAESWDLVLWLFDYVL